MIYFGAEENNMFDNLRDSSYYEDEQSDPYLEPEIQAAPVSTRRRRRNSRFLGMTPQQRFLLACMVMIIVCVMGMVALLVTDRIFLF